MFDCKMILEHMFQSTAILSITQGGPVGFWHAAGPADLCAQGDKAQQIVNENEAEKLFEMRQEEKRNMKDLKNLGTILTSPAPRHDSPLE